MSDDDNILEFLDRGRRAQQAVEVAISEVTTHPMEGEVCIGKHCRMHAVLDLPSITCPVCDMTSYHPSDIAEGYCGNCHEFTGERS